jgi:DNA-binding MarR family transcriptional regulator
VRRERDEADRRVVWLVLTDAGQRRVVKIREEIRELFRPTEAQRDPAKEKIVREFLIDVIIENHEKE